MTLASISFRRKKAPARPIERRVPATTWIRQGAHLRFPRTTAATIRWDPEQLGDPSMLVDLEIEGRRLLLPYEPVRFGGERGVLWWSGDVLVREGASTGAAEWRTARLAVPRSLLRHPNGRTEEISSHLSVEIIGESQVVHVPLTDLRRALCIPVVGARGIRPRQAAWVA